MRSSTKIKVGSLSDVLKIIYGYTSIAHEHHAIDDLAQGVFTAGPCNADFAH